METRQPYGTPEGVAHHHVPAPPPDAAVVAEGTALESVRGGKSVLGDLTAIASGRITASVLSLATALITTRMLGPSGYGTVAIVGIIAMLLFTASTAWTGVAVRRYGREDLERIGRMNRLTWTRVVLGAPLIAAATMIVLALKVFGALPSVFTWELVAIAVGTGLATVVVDHWICLLETTGKMKTSASGQVLCQAAYVAALLALVISGVRASATGVLLLSLGSIMLLVIGAAPFVWRTGVVPAVRPDRTMLRRVLWLSTPAIALLISQYVFGSIDIFVLRLYRSQTEVGVYAVAYQAYTVLSAAGVTATAVLVPLFVSMRVANREDLVTRYLVRHLPQGLFVVAVLCGLAVAPIHWAVPIVFGRAFTRAATPMVILVGGLAFLFGAYLVAPILTLHERTRTTAVINAIAAAINVVLDFVLIGLLHMGVVAPALATTVALLFMGVGFFVYARQAVGAKSAPNPIVMLPLAAGIIPALLISGPLGLPAGISSVLAAAIVVLVVRTPFSPDDARVMDQLDLPVKIKGMAVRLLRAVA